MSKQQTLHRKALQHIRTLEGLIDQMKAAGPCPLDGDNALLNTKSRLEQLARRTGV